jgi:hypothetical protein
VNPAIKYTVGRIGLFLAIFMVLIPVPISIFLKLMIALIVSSAASWFVLRGWREQYSVQLQSSMERRRAEKQRLRSALAGEDEAPAEQATGMAADAQTATGAAAADNGAAAADNGTAADTDHHTP